jgi:hypothetical protein
MSFKDADRTKPTYIRLGFNFESNTHTRIPACKHIVLYGYHVDLEDDWEYAVELCILCTECNVTHVYKVCCN